MAKPSAAYDVRLGCDVYSGHADALIAAGIVRADQLPGQPGMPSSSVTFYRGAPSSRRTRTSQRDEHYLRVVRSNENFYVYVGVPKVERDLREHGFNAQPEAFKCFMDATLAPVVIPAEQAPPERTEADEWWEALLPGERLRVHLYCVHSMVFKNSPPPTRRARR